MTGPQLNIVIGNGFVSVTPFAPPELMKVLSYWRRVTEVQGWKRIHTNRKEELFVLTPDTRSQGQQLTTMEGFLERVRTALSKAGYGFTVTDARTPLPTPDTEAAVAGLWPSQRDAVIALLKARGGVLSAPTGFGKTKISAALIRAYPRQEMVLRGTPLTVFAAPERDINFKNWEELRGDLPDRRVGILQSGTKSIVTDDVMCVTLDSLQNIDPAQVGLFICDEVHTGVSDSRSTSIQDLRWAVKFGVSATPGGRYDGKDPVIEGLFGPVAYSKSYQDAVGEGILVPIRVVWIRSPEPDAGLAYYTRLSNRDARYRHAVSYNTARNRVIAGLLDGLPQELQAVAITPTIAHIENVLGHVRGDVAVAHAETSAKKLKDSGFTKVKALATADRKKLYKSMVSGAVNRAMATYVYKQGVNFPALEVMINAGGGGSEIASKQIPGRVSRPSHDKDSAWLIDFWHPWDTKTDKYGKDVPGPVHADDKKRMRFYQQLGFEQSHCEDLDGALSLIRGQIASA